jgi:anti-anti-sigma regulatory factor
LRCSGDEDRASQSLRRQALSQAITAHQPGLDVDLTDLRFADASLMLDLAIVARRRRTGGVTHIRRARPHIARLIARVGLDRLPGIVVDTRA